MGIFGHKEGESSRDEAREVSKPFSVEWLINGNSHIAQLSVNREHPTTSKSDNLFRDSITPGLKEIEAQGYTISSIAPTYIDPGSGDALDFVVVAQPVPSPK